jgi:hypothetical protein
MMCLVSCGHQQGEIAMKGWRQWNPGLDTDGVSLQEMYDGMPRNSADDIDPLVRIFENPASVYAFPGAVNLLRHDCIHILLGRGMLPQDEAFVIGYTMGTAKERITWKQAECFKMVATVAYKPPYKFTEEQLTAFDLGFSLGIIDSCETIYEFPFEDHMGVTLGALRRLLGIDCALLRMTYRTEARQMPGTVESSRLPI